MPESPQHSASTLLQTRDRQIAHLAFNFALDMASHGIPGLKPLESLMMMAINQANIAPLTRDPAARSRYGALEAPAPDDERRPVSVRAGDSPRKSVDKVKNFITQPRAASRSWRPSAGAADP